ncbi:MAG: class I SAM-dependent methyltransferase [Bdellovibrionales bacterium]|nr:class I SAM-dependent methyltransferase [Bdellovibrionales bacterium]
MRLRPAAGVQYRKKQGCRARGASAVVVVKMEPGGAGRCVAAENPARQWQGMATNIETRPDEGQSGATSLVHSAELAELNSAHAFPSEVLLRPTTGFWGRLLSFFRQRVLADYAERQTRYQAALVRLLNRFAEGEAQRQVRMDDVVTGSATAVEQRLERRIDRVAIELQRKISELEGLARGNRTQLETLESVARGLERIIARLSVGQQSAVSNHGGASSGGSGEPLGEREAAGTVDYRYLLLENRFRGSEPAIAARLTEYLDVLSAEAAPILEVGAGRGELLELLRERGIRSYGLEIDRAMVETCRAKGLDVRLEDAIEHLSNVSEASLGAIIAVQVVEHFTPRQLEAFLQAALRALRADGRIVLETINTESMVALTRNYFRDPTHQQPLHPETMRFILEMNGFDVQEVRKLSAFASGACLQRLATEEYMPPRWQATIDLLNHNFATLNDLLFGSQDYCVIAKKPQ